MRYPGGGVELEHERIAVAVDDQRRETIALAIDQAESGRLRADERLPLGLRGTQLVREEALIDTYRLQRLQHLDAYRRQRIV